MAFPSTPHYFYWEILFTNNDLGWGCSLIVEHLPTLHKDLCCTTSTEERRKEKKKKEKKQ
jgi:hypothetical protein